MKAANKSFKAMQRKIDQVIKSTYAAADAAEELSALLDAYELATHKAEEARKLVTNQAKAFPKEKPEVFSVGWPRSEKKAVNT